MAPADAQALQAELIASTDPALLVEVGNDLIQMSKLGGDPGLKAKGKELINRAISLEPANARWKGALQAADYPPPPPPPPPPSPGAGTSGPIRIGGAVAEANLIRKVRPEYPPTAVAARISGTVEFTAIIGKEGQIQRLELVRGHPLLVNAARQAVLQYAYRPLMLNGVPVSVMTSIIVPFEAP